MRLDINESANSVQLTLDDRRVSSTEEVRPGVTLQYDADGILVGVEIERLRVEVASPSTPKDSTIDPIANRVPCTPLGALLIETRRKLQEEGVPFLSEEDFHREVEDRRGLPPEERLV
jgi:hypothetical protein